MSPDGSCIRLSTTYSSGSDLSSPEAPRAWRSAMILFVSLAVHSFPEGSAVAAPTMHPPKLGITTAIAIAFHTLLGKKKALDTMFYLILYETIDETSFSEALSTMLVYCLHVANLVQHTHNEETTIQPKAILLNTIVCY
jgi:hypothetical protein